MRGILFRPQFETLKITEKLALMRDLADRHGMAFRELYVFSKWGRGLTTGVFEKDGREFVFVPGDTVTLGWKAFAVGVDKDSRAELRKAFEEFGYQDSVKRFCGRVCHWCIRPLFRPCWWGANWRRSAGSGLSFERPDFKRRIADIEAGEVKRVIIKDMSAWAATTCKWGCSRRFSSKRTTFTLSPSATGWTARRATTG